MLAERDGWNGDTHDRFRSSRVARRAALHLAKRP
jgi:hypothetical protein